MQFIVLFGLISLMSSVKAEGNEKEWDEMKWEDVYQLALYSKSGSQTTEELVSMLEYLDKRPHYISGQKSLVKDYLEFSKISQWRCHRGFFRYLIESIGSANAYGTTRMFGYLIEVEKNQFNACKDLWTRDILLAKDKLDRETQVKAKQFLDSFKVEPIPYANQYFFPKDTDLENNLIKGALDFVESHFSGPLKSKGFLGNDKKLEIEQKYDKLVKKLCERVEDKLELETEVFEKLYRSEELIPSMDREVLDWIQIEGICRFALKTGIDKLAREGYSIVVKRDKKAATKNSPQVVGMFYNRKI